MNTITRRNILAATPAFALASCAGGAGALTPAAIIQQAVTLATGLAGAITNVAAAYPTLIPPNLLKTIQTDLGLAQGAAGTLVATLPATTGAATIQTVEGYINAVLNILAGPPINGLIPSPFNMAVTAAAILVPQLEAFVTSIIPAAPVTAAASASRAKLLAPKPAMTPAEALAELQKYTS